MLAFVDEWSRPNEWQMPLRCHENHDHSKAKIQSKTRVNSFQVDMWDVSISLLPRVFVDASVRSI